MKEKVEKSPKFADGLCVYKLFWIFLIVSVLGVYYEQILNLITHYFKSQSFFWERRAGVIYGPLSPIYGFGAICMIMILLRKKRTNWQLFLLGSIVGGIFEYGMSYLQEIFTGTVSWNYSRHFLNIGGRTTIPFMLVWGAFAILLVKGIYPKLSEWIENIPCLVGNKLTRFFIVIVFLDCIISLLAVTRQTLRRNDIPPLTPIDRIMDAYFTDSDLTKRFPNMHMESRE